MFRMSRVYALVPLVAVTAFLAYYAHWNDGAVLRPLPHERSGDRYFARDGAKEGGLRTRTEFAEAIESETIKLDHVACESCDLTLDEVLEKEDLKWIAV